MLETLAPSLVWLVICTDGPDAPRLRDLLIGDHLRHVEQHYDRIALAGPMPQGPEGGFSASLFMVKADSAEAAEAFIRTDPYHAGGVYAACEVRPFNAVFGHWFGGKVWDSIEGAEARAAERLRVGERR